MRTFYTILIGIMLLLAILFISRILRGRFSPTLFFILFILMWFAAMSWNMYMGIQAGYAFKEEFLIFLLNFGIPSLLATYFIYKNKSSI
ncbi:hypothetical protein ASC84_18090 [Acinetobacter sp. Root1280]|nr:hypothetical protein ASC84_18090 [Acinetobacter sp. Root1280]